MTLAPSTLLLSQPCSSSDSHMFDTDLGTHCLSTLQHQRTYSDVNPRLTAYTPFDLCQEDRILPSRHDIKSAGSPLTLEHRRNYLVMEPRLPQIDVTQSSSEYEKNCGTLSPRTSRAGSIPFQPQLLDTSLPPQTVVLGLWPGARPEQIDYYDDGYRSLYPSAKVVLLHHSNTSTQHVESALTELIDDREKPPMTGNQNTLIHLFGDDAASQISRLLRGYRARTNQPLGARAIVLDSAPIVIAPSIHILLVSPHRFLVFVQIAITAIIWRLTSILILWFSEPLSAHVQRDLHDQKLLPADARKCYIFPERGIMFAWDRPTYAEEACERQAFEVKRQRVDQLQQRWSGDQERYWLGIENAWEGK